MLRVVWFKLKHQSMGADPGTCTQYSTCMSRKYTVRTGRVTCLSLRNNFHRVHFGLLEPRCAGATIPPLKPYHNVRTNTVLWYPLLPNGTTRLSHRRGKGTRCYHEGPIKGIDIVPF
jgi:hypothetical protein